MAPKLTLNDNMRGIVSATESDGSELFVEVEIIAKAANTKPYYIVRCRLVNGKGPDIYLPPNGIYDGQEGGVEYLSQTPFVVGFTTDKTDKNVKQPHIVVLSEGTVIHVSVMSEAGQEANGATLDVTVEQSKIGDVDTKNINPKTTIQVPHIAVQKKRVIDFVKYGKIMTIPMADKSASGNEPRIELILGPPGKEIEAPANWKTSPAKKPLPDSVQKAADGGTTIIFLNLALCHGLSVSMSRPECPALTQPGNSPHTLDYGVASGVILIVPALNAERIDLVAA